jgi:hypothetical protein
VLKNFALYIVLLFLYTGQILAQQKPVGTFLSDSVRIGEPVKYALVYYHHKNQEVFFPDSIHSFSPFEFIKKKYFPTRTTDTLSIDSVVYTIRTFEVRNNLELSLPVFILDQEDTLREYSTSDRIALKQYIAQMPDTIILRTAADYRTVKLHYNYPYHIATGIVLLLVLLVLYLVFGKTILRHYRLYVMHLKHRQYMKMFDKLQEEMKLMPNVRLMEKVLGEWKDYLTKLEQKPINTFTTTEIIALFNKEGLKESLQIVDRSIYRGILTEQPAEALSVLKKFSNKRYKKRRKELRNAGK